MNSYHHTRPAGIRAPVLAWPCLADAWKTTPFLSQMPSSIPSHLLKTSPSLLLY